MTEEERLATVLASWHSAAEGGDAPDLEEVVRAHPDLEQPLRRHFAALAVFERIAHPGRDDPSPPFVLGDFRLLRSLGSGGMGVVYEAEQVSLGRRVALKVLHPGVTASPRAQERFRREARALALLRHPNLVPVHQMGVEEGTWYFAMELVAGRSLADLVEERREGRRPPEGGVSLPRDARSMARLLAGAADGLQAAHEAGVVHRDIKPSNLLLDVSGALRVVDFGLAKVASEPGEATVPGMFLGTPGYASPEQCSGSQVRVDARTDVYSLGASLYEALTLRPPFRGETLPEVFAAILGEDPPRPRILDPGIPVDLETVVVRAMEKEPARRYSTAGELALDLRLFAEGAPVRARPVGPLGRLWKHARRRPIVASLGATVVVLGVLAGILGIRAGVESTRRTESRYAEICTWSLEALLGGEDEGPASRASLDKQGLRLLLAEAARSLPRRPEAHLDLGLAPGATLAEKMESLDRARSAGVGERAWRLARAAILRDRSRSEEAVKEEALAEAVPGAEDPVGAYFEGRVLLRVGRRTAAIECLTKTIEKGEVGTLVHRLALQARYLAHILEGDVTAAFGDLQRMARWEPALGPGTRTELTGLGASLGAFRGDLPIEAVVPFASDGGPSVWDPETRRLFVVDGYNGGSVRALDGRTHREVASIRTPGYDRTPALDGDRGELFVPLQFDKVVVVLDTRELRINREIDLSSMDAEPGATLGMAVLDSPRRRLLVVMGSEILAFDPLTAGRPESVQRLTLPVPGDTGITMDVDRDSGAVLAAREGTSVLVRFGPDGSVERVSVPVALRKIAVGPGLGRLYLLSTGLDEVVVLDVATMEVLHRLKVPPRWAQDLVVDPVRSRLYLCGGRQDGPLTAYDAVSLERRALVTIPGCPGPGEHYVALDPATSRISVTTSAGWVAFLKDIEPRK